MLTTMTTRPITLPLTHLCEVTNRTTEIVILSASYGSLSHLHHLSLAQPPIPFLFLVEQNRPAFRLKLNGTIWDGNVTVIVLPTVGSAYM